MIRIRSYVALGAAARPRSGSARARARDFVIQQVSRTDEEDSDSE